MGIAMFFKSSDFFNMCTAAYRNKMMCCLGFVLKHILEKKNKHEANMATF